jgi:(1->4)-alpha-D-glucan 1-alpha-D-glucosylmutase
MLGFVRDALDTSRANAFLGAFLPFQERIARLGMHNSLVQTALKLTLPGIPDIYQGAELWDLSLVDPDNRRPVDYRARIELLTQVSASLRKNRAATMLALLEDWRDPRIKLAVTATLLAFRHAHPRLLSEGGYEPLVATGPKADQVCAFARNHDGATLMVAATRFPARLDADRDWTGTAIPWPATADALAGWRDLLSGRVVGCRGDAVDAAAVLGDRPVAALVPDSAYPR